MPGMMAESHINGFLADIRRANPGFSESTFFGFQTSSLRGLLQYLRATQGNPQRFRGIGEAIWRCDNPMDRRLQKYRAAIGNLVRVWGTGAPYPGQEVAISRVVFRGDTRAPNAIFATGFLPRRADRFRFRDLQQDIDPEGAVALSTRPSVAANFPLPGAWGPNAMQDASGRSYVYACYLERGFNTAGLQGMNFVDGNAAAGNLLYAGELASSGIPPHHIIGGIEVWRNFIYAPGVARPADWFTRGVFRFVRNTWQANPRYAGPAVPNLSNLFTYEMQPFLPPGAPARGPMNG